MVRIPAEESAAAGERDRRSFTSSLVFAIAFGALAMYYSLFLYSVLYHHRLQGHNVWFAPGDIWQMVGGGSYVWHGALGYVYRGTPSYALPLSFILTAPISAIIEHFNLVEGILPIPRASAWPLAASFGLMFNIFVLDAARRLAWSIGMRRQLWLVQLLTVGVVLVPMFEWGHYEDVLALTFVLHAARYLMQQSWVRAAILISLAVSSKQWALMLIPLVVLMAPRGRRLITLVAACALPAMFVLLVFGVDFRRASESLFSPINMGRNTPGHLAFYATWLGRKTSAVSRALGVACSPLLAWRVRRISKPAQILAAMSVMVLIRPFFEAINYAYYWAPPLLLAGFTGLARRHRVRIRDWIWPALAEAWTLPHGNPNEITFWWLVFGFLLCATYAQVAMNCTSVTPKLPRLLSRLRGSEALVTEVTPSSAPGI